MLALISRKSPQKTFSLTKTKMFLYTVIYTTKKLDLLVLIWRQWRHRLVLEIIAYIKQYTAYSVIYKTKYFFLQRPIPSNILSSIYESIKYKNYLHLIYIHKGKVFFFDIHVNHSLTGPNTSIYSAYIYCHIFSDYCHFTHAANNGSIH